MLGQFLEFSFAAAPLARAFEFYRSLGFQPVTVGDQLTDPYVALSDGASRSACTTATAGTAADVRPAAPARLRAALRRAGVDIEQAHSPTTSSTRSCSPIRTVRRYAARGADVHAGEWNQQNVSACGEFLEYSIPTHSLEASRSFWEIAGLSAVADGHPPHPWLRLAGQGLVIGLHQARFRSGLSFQSSSSRRDSSTCGRRASTSEVGPRSRTASRVRDAHLSPDGSSIYLIEARASESRAAESRDLSALQNATRSTRAADYSCRRRRVDLR